MFRHIHFIYLPRESNYSYVHSVGVVVDRSARDYNGSLSWSLQIRTYSQVGSNRRALKHRDLGEVAWKKSRSTKKIVFSVTRPHYVLFGETRAHFVGFSVRNQMSSCLPKKEIMRTPDRKTNFLKIFVSFVLARKMSASSHLPMV